jgi:protein tyrosine phosphatase (PTP) superfamily phosphohydrolase (DUF442 family)
MRMERIPRPLRPVLVVLAGWLGLFLAVNLVIMVAGLAARWADKDPRIDDDGWPDITNLRLAGDRVLVGGATSAEQYRELADRGVTLVIDMRTGSRSDTTTDDPELLAELGVDHARVPISDGRAPTPAQTRRFLELVDGADGLVFAHCGGGVGRSTSIAATYEAALGQDPSVLEQVATGPPTIEQIWYVGTLQPNEPEHGISPVIAVGSRIVDFPRRVYGLITSVL